VGVERGLLGESDPEHRLPDDLPYLRNAMGRAMEVAVDIRRSVPGPKVLDELRDALDRRLAALPSIDPDQDALLPNGRTGTYARLMVFRAFDCWTHEQDIRRAVGRPGNLDGPAAACALDILSGGLPYVVGKVAAAAPGQSVAFEVTGAVPFTRQVIVGDDRRARFADIAEPTVTLRMGWETYTRLACGRLPADAVDVTVSGDEDLAHRVLTAMPVTP
jgi:uncharacterized protein (TIGR03083 family)